MRKIYPPPFNKFVVFVFYSLLSIAAIVSSQGTLMDNGCKPSTLNFTNRPVIGYVQPGIDLNTIQWDLYSYINFIVSDYNNPEKNKDQYTPLIFARNANGKNVKILLSIRNYDRSTWKDDKDFYDALDNISEFITKNNFDGVDIEYPGMRGFPCNQKSVNDVEFGAFIRNMKDKLQKKILMLTVGSTSSPNEEIISLIDESNVDLLNIETYHFSLYASPNQFNTVGNNVTTNPNSPYGRFKQAYDIWSSRIGKGKIFMGIDFGNTFQIVTNKAIMDNQTVDYQNVVYDIPESIKGQLIQFKNLCNNQPNAALQLYSWPWKNLSAYALDYSQTNGSYGSCNTKDNWTRKFDHTNSVPWLYNNKPYNSNVELGIFYVSYEDFSSLYVKLLAVGGVSISDISYDDDKNSLLNFIRGNQLPSSPVDLPPKNNPGKGTSPLNPTDSTNADDKNPLDNHKANAGVIVGAVLGGLLLLVVSCFVWYRRKYILNSKDAKDAGAISKSTMRSHTATKNAEMSCDSSPNRFASPTTIIPVACGYVTAMFDFEGKEENDLSFKKGDKIEVLERGDGPNDWWVGRVNNTVGEFPGNYVKETG